MRKIDKAIKAKTKLLDKKIKPKLEKMLDKSRSELDKWKPDDFPELTPLQFKYVLARASGKTVRESAAAAGTTYYYAHNLCNDPNIQSAVEIMRNNAMSKSFLDLDEIMRICSEIARDDEKTPFERLAAVDRVVKLKGLNAPVKHDVRTANVQIKLSDLSNEQLEELKKGNLLSEGN